MLWRVISVYIGRFVVLFCGLLKLKVIVIWW